LDNKRLI